MEKAYLAEFSGFDAISSEYFRIDEANELSKALEYLEKDPHALLVFNRDLFRGLVRERDLLQFQLRSEEIKINEVMLSIPTVDPGTELTEVARLLLENNLRVIPVSKDDEIIGIIRDVDLLALAGTTEFGEVPVAEVMTKQVVTVPEEESIAKIFNKFREWNISRVPVVNDSDEVVGIVTAHDLVRELISVRKEKTSAETGPFSFEVLHAPAKEKMNHPVVTVSEESNLRDVIRKMGRQLSSVVVVDKQNRAKGIITIKDLLEPLSVKPVETEYFITVNGRGFDEVDRERIIEEAQDFLAKFQEFLGGGDFHIHIKTHNRQFRERLLYSVRTRLSTHKGFLFTSSSDGWGLEDAFYQALEKLERQLLSEKDILEDRIRSELLVQSYSAEEL
ncbi:MAG: CBS domain-containing protein [Candidatus Heimdallarchaeota archaeon]